VEQPGVLATLTWWRSLVQIQPRLLNDAPVAQRQRRLLYTERIAGSSPAGSTAEWTGAWFPARSHKPSDAGSNPASATCFLRLISRNQSRARARKCRPFACAQGWFSAQGIHWAAGPIWYDSWFAPRQSGFNSPAVHCFDDVCSDGETDNHTELLPRRSRFESWSGYLWMMVVVV
jgi:hypothetical protein